MFRFGRFAHTGRIYFEGDAAGGAAPAGGADAAGAAAGGQAPAGAAAPAAAPAAGAETDQTVPYDRFKSVNDEKAAAIARATAAEERVKTLERAGQSDAERAASERADAIARAEAAEKKSADLEAAQVTAQRNGWIRDAAAGAKFHNAANAVGALADETIESERQAKAAVEKLAKEQPHLVQAVTKDGGEMLERILKGGKTGDAGDDKALDPDAFNALTQDQLVDLQVNQPEVYAASLRRAAAA